MYITGKLVYFLIHKSLDLTLIGEFTWKINDAKYNNYVWGKHKTHCSKYMYVASIVGGSNLFHKE